MTLSSSLFLPPANRPSGGNGHVTPFVRTYERSSSSAFIFIDDDDDDEVGARRGLRVEVAALPVPLQRG